jgi:hypothetical protein
LLAPGNVHTGGKQIPVDHYAVRAVVVFIVPSEHAGTKFEPLAQTASFRFWPFLTISMLLERLQKGPGSVIANVGYERCM